MKKKAFDGVHTLSFALLAALTGSCGGSDSNASGGAAQDGGNCFGDCSTGGSAGSVASAGAGGSTATGGRPTLPGNGGTANGAGGTGSGGAPSTCGNGVLDANEGCDSPDFGGATCSTVTMAARPRGNLVCTRTCTIDSRGCLAPAGSGGTPGTGGANGTGGGTGGGLGTGGQPSDAGTDSDAGSPPDGGAMDGSSGGNGSSDASTSPPCIWVDYTDPAACNTSLTIAKSCPAGRQVSRLERCSDASMFVPDSTYQQYQVQACPDTGCASNTQHVVFRRVECCYPGSTTDAGGGVDASSD